jgi:hypothetical protein
VRLLATGRGAFQFRSWNGFRFTIELSTNLVDWTPVANVTNTTGVVQFTDPDAPQHEQRFYRVESE